MTEMERVYRIMMGVNVSSLRPVERVALAAAIDAVEPLMPHRECANETCGRAFAMRPSQKPSLTRNVLFCSERCARAQAQREYRRRQRDQD